MSTSQKQGKAGRMNYALNMGDPYAFPERNPYEFNEGKKYVLEHAKSGRGKCGGKCKQLMPLGTLKVGYMYVKGMYIVTNTNFNVVSTAPHSPLHDAARTVRKSWSNRRTRPNLLAMLHMCNTTASE